MQSNVLPEMECRRSGGAAMPLTVGGRNRSCGRLKGLCSRPRRRNGCCKSLGV